MLRQVGSVAMMVTTLTILALMDSHATYQSRGSPQGYATVTSADDLCHGDVVGTMQSPTGCEPFQVSLRLAAACRPRPLRLAYVHLDIGEEVRWLRQSSQSSVEVLKAIIDRETRSAVMYFGMDANEDDVFRVDVPLTADLELVQRNSGIINFGNGVLFYGSPLRAVRAAHKLIDEGIASELPRFKPDRLIIFTGQAKTEDIVQRQLLEARQDLADAGIGLIVACTSKNAPVQCQAYRKMPVNPALYTDPHDPPSTLSTLLAGEIAKLRAKPSTGPLYLHHHLPPTLTYLPASASASPVTVTHSFSGTELAWAWHPPTTTLPADLTYRVAPSAPGDAVITGELTIVDPDGNRHVQPMQPVTVTDSGPCLVPTEPPPPTATPTVTPLASPTPTSTPTATPTSTRVPMPVYLPLLLRHECTDVHQRADIVLTVDTSGSMAGPKLAAAQAAALDFVRLMDLALGRDQVALVRFDSDAQLVQPLTADRALINAAIAGLTARQGTYMDRGLDAALGALAGPSRNLANQPVIVLLTDGQQTGGPAAALAAADRVRHAGVVLYTIGLGTDLDAATLTTMAGGSAHYRHAPDASALATVYAEVARDIRCAGSLGFAHLAEAPPIGTPHEER